MSKGFYRESPYGSFVPDRDRPDSRPAVGRRGASILLVGLTVIGRLSKYRAARNQHTEPESSSTVLDVPSYFRPISISFWLSPYGPLAAVSQAFLHAPAG